MFKVVSAGADGASVPAKFSGTYSQGGETGSRPGVFRLEARIGDGGQFREGRRPALDIDVAVGDRCELTDGETRCRIQIQVLLIQRRQAGRDIDLAAALCVDVTVVMRGADNLLPLYARR